MADLTVSADVDTFMGAANFAAMRTALGAASLGGNTFTGAQTLPLGTAAAASLAVGQVGTGLFSPGVGLLSLAANGTEMLCIDFGAGGGGFRLRGTQVLGWTTGTPSGTLSDVGLTRVAAKTLRLGMSSSSAPGNGAFVLGEDGTGSDIPGGNGIIRSGLGTGGGTPSNLQFSVPTTTGTPTAAQSYVLALMINSTGLTAAGNIVSGAGGTHAWTGRTTMLSPADGVMQLTNNAQNDFSRLMFGGTGAASPALKKGVAQLICRLADDSANALFVAGAFQTDAPVGGSSSVWRLGTVASVTPTSPNRTIEVEIAGTTYYLAAKTTNN